MSKDTVPKYSRNRKKVAGFRRPWIFAIERQITTGALDAFCALRLLQSHIKMATEPNDHGGLGMLCPAIGTIAGPNALQVLTCRLYKILLYWSEDSSSFVTGGPDAMALLSRCTPLGARHCLDSLGCNRKRLSGFSRITTLNKPDCAVPRYKRARY